MARGRRFSMVASATCSPGRGSTVAGKLSGPTLVTVWGVTITAVGAGRVGAVVLVGSGGVGVANSLVAVGWGPPDVTMRGWVAVGLTEGVGDEQAASNNTTAEYSSFRRIDGIPLTLTYAVAEP